MALEVTAPSEWFILEPRVLPRDFEIKAVSVPER
jgi:hypothetical protein